LPNNNGVLTTSHG